ncbi:hypothetical protein PM082_017169 [Marasmius tenuissimus]|nr:hypothetical protein PM082_017169 [Marasmius tenuissimus]
MALFRKRATLDPVSWDGSTYPLREDLPRIRVLMAQPTDVTTLHHYVPSRRLTSNTFHPSALYICAASSSKEVYGGTFATYVGPTLDSLTAWQWNSTSVTIGSYTRIEDGTRF